jgi:hypothetical protein
MAVRRDAAAARALEALNDEREELRALTANKAKDISETIAVYTKREEAIAAQQKAREAELKQVAVAPADLETIMSSFGLTKAVADKLLRVHGGSVEAATAHLVYGEGGAGGATEALGRLKRQHA